MVIEPFDTSLVEYIEIKMIRPSQFLVRDKYQYSMENESLVNSIKEHGLLQPILIRPISTGFEIVAGHRRFAACKSLRWRYISCKIREMFDKQAYEIQLTENIQRKTMDPIDEAEAFRKYVQDYGWGGISELARKIGKSEEYVSHRIQLLKLPDDVRTQIISNKLNVSQALELTTIPPDKLVSFANQIMENELTVRKIREIKQIMKNEELLSNDESFNYNTNKTSEPIKISHISKKTDLALKIVLARIDNLINEVQTTIPPNNRGDVVQFLMNIRLKIHGLIDESIRFRNSHSY